MVQSEFGIKKHQGKMETIPSGGGDVKMWEIFSRHTLDSLVPVKQLFKGPAGLKAKQLSTT